MQTLVNSERFSLANMARNCSVEPTARCNGKVMCATRLFIWGREHPSQAVDAAATHPSLFSLRLNASRREFGLVTLAEETYPFDFASVKHHPAPFLSGVHLSVAIPRKFRRKE